VNAYSRLVIACSGAVLAAAAAPSVFAQAQGGLWEITRGSAAPVRICLPNPAVLAQYEHRNSRCTRSVLHDSGSAATVSYSCGGDFGQSSITALTPRSLRVQTQGISGNAPFKYSFDARRVGDCPAH
jgi:hypothetical protein